MRMDSNEIRKKFLDFFKEKNHRIIPGYPLIPDDPTLLFTSAGMVQFKPLWVEKKQLAFSRAVTVQKCLRAGGKDSDLENVGKSTRHHSFFEMLGNFSFGDYFKEEAIFWAWEFVTDVLKLPRENIWVSVYEKDKESFQIWQKILKTKRIVFLGKKDNFWGPAGDSGPCGPCSEIYFDLGKEFGCGKKSCQPGCSCERFLEFWNLVFPQFDQEKGKLLPLGRRGVDTGMGLERIASLSQGKGNDYATDLFIPIIKEIEIISGAKYGQEKENNSSIQIIADHIRAIVFAISEGIYPENTGRGYVIRRIIRRAARAGRNLRIKNSFLHRLVPVVAAIMQEPYPELSEKNREISLLVKGEEEKFRELLDSGEKLFSEIIASLPDKQIPGSVLFKLYDTYGLPLDLLEEMAEEEGLFMDKDGFEKLLKKQREKGRKTSKFVSAEIRSEESRDIIGEKMEKTVFAGYDQEKVKTKILGFFRSDQKVDEIATSAKADSQRLHQIDVVVLQKTPFYPEMGGQVGDKGLIKSDDMGFEVINTRKNKDDVVFHLGKFKKKPLTKIKGAEVIAAVDRSFRKKVSANHTATHLLHWALRKVLGKEVKQAGSFVGEKYLRFDFTYSQEISGEKLRKIEEEVNQKIWENSLVSSVEMDLEEAKGVGAIALFSDKYEKRVRVISIGDYSKEVCGGTHLARTGEVGLFLIKGLSSIGKGIKRIEALSREAAYQQIKNEKMVMERLSMRLKSPVDLIPARIEQLFEEESDSRKKREILARRLLNSETKDLLNKIKIIKGIKLISEEVVGFNQNELRILAENLQAKLNSGIILLTVKIKDKPFLVVAVTKNLIEKGFFANRIVKELSVFLGGGGGGRENFAQGSGKNSSQLKEALRKIEEIIRKHE